MKKLTITLGTAFMLFLICPPQLKADNEPTKAPITATEAVRLAESEAMVLRLKEIKAMDISTLKPEQKKELRKEVRSIKSELKANSESTAIEGRQGGFFISVGAAIIIALLLIILL
ncbi:MAG: hypothetical protein AAGU19_21695 [Prolixibacteraceae bacterium]